MFWISDYNTVYRYIILPNNSTRNIIEKNLKNFGIKTFIQSSKTIRDLINNRNNNPLIESIYYNLDMEFHTLQTKLHVLIAAKNMLVKLSPV